MKIVNIPLNLIAEYIGKEEIGYQEIDGLIEVTHGSDDPQTKILLTKIDQAKKAILVKKDSEEDLSAYHEIIEWSEPSDTLVLLDNGIMLLFPKHKDENYPILRNFLIAV